jgi:ribonuclease HIII
MNFVINIDSNNFNRVTTFYKDYQKPAPNEHIVFFAQTDLVTISLYKTGKLVFQGEDAEEEFNMWNTLLNNQKQVVFKKQSNFHNFYYSSIGSDEVGKGDVFGPIVICSAYLPQDHIETIKSLGIKDSKQLSDKTIMNIGEKLVQIIPHSVLILHNEKYNDLVKRGYNINKMIAYLHNRAIINVLKRINEKPEVILDQFAEERLYFRYLADEKNVYKNITFLTKAESKYASVAIASIIARYVFLIQFDRLSIECGYPLLKGAGKNVDIVLQKIVAEKGEAYLYSFAKMNFKNFTKIN